MQQVIEFLKENPYGFLATIDGERPRVRPFGFMFEEGGKLYFCTNSTKNVYRQMIENPKVEYSTMDAARTMLRIAGEAVFTEERDKKEKVIELSQIVKNAYKTADNPALKVFFIGHGSAVMKDFSGRPPRVVEF